MASSDDDITQDAYDETPCDTHGVLKSDSDALSQVYIAHYTSPTNETPTKGFFEFDSINRASSKRNLHDARMKMLEIYGKDAVSWVIDDVKIKKKKDEVCGDQLEFDFRQPKQPRKRRASKKWL